VCVSVCVRVHTHTHVKCTYTQTHRTWFLRCPPKIACNTPVSARRLFGEALSLSACVFVCVCVCVCIDK